MHTRVIAGIVIVLIASNALFGTTVFSDGFDGYSDPVPFDLPGHGGWEPHANPALGTQIRVNDIPGGLSTKTVSGLESSGIGSDQHAAVHPVPGGLQLDKVYILSFDAYANGAPPHAVPNLSHNGLVGFTDNDPSNTLFTFHWGALHFGPGSTQVDPYWTFAASGSAPQDFPGHFNTTNRLQVVLDPINHEVFGRADWDYDGSFDMDVETTHVPLSLVGFQSVPWVQIYQDFRDPGTHVGVDFDNINVDAIPEPSGLALLAFAAASCLACRRRLPRVIVAAALALLTSNVLLAATPSYIATDLGTLGGTSSAAYGINASGQVTGKAKTTGDAAEHAFRWTSGLMTDLHAPFGGLGGTNSTGNKINASGQVTGWSHTSGIDDGTEHAFRTAPNAVIVPATDDLHTPYNALGGTRSRGIGINASGRVTGFSTTSGALIEHAYRTDPNAPIDPTPPTDDLGTLGGMTSTAHTISDSGKVVGQANTPTEQTRAFLYDSGPMINLGTLGGTASSSAYDINESGPALRIVGDSDFDPSGNDHAFLWTQGASDGVAGNPQMKDLHLAFSLPRPLTSDARGINDSGQVVGIFSVEGGLGRHAFLYSDGVMYDLNDLNLTPGWILTDAYDINDLGQIVGEGLIGGETHGFLLNVPEPSGLMLLAMGSASVFLRRWRDSVPD